MADSPTRPTQPVPGAGETPRCGAPLTAAAASACQAVPAAAAWPPPYSRTDWEAAVIAGHLPHTARLLAFVLAHLAGPAGRLPSGGGHQPDYLARMTRLPRRQTQLSLNTLERAGYITRPDIRTWGRDKLRPITLTIPAEAEAVRTEPPHPGGAA